MKMNLDTSIDNINYLRYMQQEQDKVQNDRESKVNQNDTWSGFRPPRSEDKNR